MTIAVDASVVAAALVDNGADGTWARQLLAEEELIAPQLMPAECANIIRLAELKNDITPESAALAYADLLSLQTDLMPFQPFAQRIWQLRQTVTSYDAWYVAIAEQFDLSLATLDFRLARAQGPSCQFLMP